MIEIENAMKNITGIEILILNTRFNIKIDKTSNIIKPNSIKINPQYLSPSI